MASPSSPARAGFKIPAIRAVGMHHWGAPELAIDVPFHLIREPHNKYDPLAIAVQDGHNTKAYIMRDDARRLSRILDSVLVLDKRAYIKFHQPAQVKSHKVGPQQEGNMAFRCEICLADDMCHLLKEVGLHYEQLSLRTTAQK